MNLLMAICRRGNMAGGEWKIGLIESQHLWGNPWGGRNLSDKRMVGPILVRGGRAIHWEGWGRQSLKPRLLGIVFEAAHERFQMPIANF